MDVSQLLAAYDDQLRLDAETPSALAVRHIGPLRLVTFAGGRGFVTYRDLGGADGDDVRRLVGAVMNHYGNDPSIARVEWKTRGHDHAPGLHEALVEHDFDAQQSESIMIGQAASLALDLPLPAGVALRRITEPTDVLAMCEMVGGVFGDSDGRQVAEDLLARQARQSTSEANERMELWVAEIDGDVVCAGRLEPVPGSDFAGIWGGATRADWRGRGVYRALTAARARSAMGKGKTLINSDSTEASRPILERSGLIKVSTTTPYLWRR